MPGTSTSQRKTSQKVTAKKARAAILLAEDELTDEQIADEIGITRRQLARWKHDSEFNALVGDHVGQLQASARKFSVAKRYKRVEALDMVFRKILQAIELRAQDNAHNDEALSAAMRHFNGEPASEVVTGLFAKKQSISASGRIVTDVVFDSALVRELREVMKQAAQDNGDWVEKSEQEQTTTTLVQIIGDDDDEDEDE